MKNTSAKIHLVYYRHLKLTPLILASHFQFPFTSIAILSSMAYSLKP